jgi:hypothetical protein
MTHTHSAVTVFKIALRVYGLEINALKSIDPLCWARGNSERTSCEPAVLGAGDTAKIAGGGRDESVVYAEYGDVGGRMSPTDGVGVDQFAV